MPARKEDEIMAEHLLKGGKMLEKSCRTCGCPLFEVKGKTLCVVCAENEAAVKGTPNAQAGKKPALPAGKKTGLPAGNEGDLEAQLAATIRSLCQRVRDEQDPAVIVNLMNAVRAGSEALGILRRS